MKNIIFVNGTMAVGKSSVCKYLNALLPASVYLDGDWCWTADPFTVTDETKEMVTDNICHLLNNFIRCSRYENIIFCWVMDYESIYDSIATRLDMENCNIFRYTITCSPQALKQRIEGDTVQSGRDFDKSMERISRFDSMNTVKINNDNMSAYETAVLIKNMVYSR